MKQKSFSIKYRVILWVSLLLIPLAILLSVIAVLQIDETRERMEASERTNLNLLVSRLKQETGDVENYLYDLALDNREFRSMADTRTGTQLYASAYEVFQASDSLFDNQQGLSYLILYSEENGFFVVREAERSEFSLPERTVLREAVERRLMRFFIQAQSEYREWFTLQIAERWFLCRTLRYQGMYCAALFDLQGLANRMERQFAQGGALVFRSGGVPVTALPEGIGERDLTRDAILRISGQQYLILDAKLYDVEMSYISAYSGISGAMRVSLLLVFFLIFLLLALLVLFYLRLRRDFFRPLDGLVETMREIRDGHMETVSEDLAVCEEFQEVNLTFQQMLTQIQSLKIDRYEKELDSQRAELAFLLAQIRPHFYLNCLKTLYGLAEQRQYTDIEKCILLVSKHLRYAFQKHTDTVPLREELELCDNYIKLYGLMTDTLPRLTLDVESTLLDTPIPPISLLTFVENSIRINLTPQSELEIGIRVRRMQTEEQELLCLAVQDNGMGFDEMQLKKLNGAAWLRESGNHVGLQNVVRRFQLIYGEEFSVAFFNHNGAVQEMYLPMKMIPKKGDVRSEALDRR